MQKSKSYLYSNFMETLRMLWTSKDIRNRIIFTIFIIFIFRLAAHIVVPGVDPTAVSKLFDSGGALSVFAALTGGSMSNFSIVMMGLAPYINASIIVQLMTVIVPKLEQLSKEGEQGQRKISSITRWLTFPLALLQSYGMIIIISSSATASGDTSFIDIANKSELIPAMITIAAGTMFLVWLGEMITEKGIGNGISLIIFTGIISAIPGVIGNLISQSQFGETSKIMPFVVFVFVTIIMLIVVVTIMSAQRSIGIINASRGNSGTKTTLPIKLLQSGMIPIIFAISLMTFPSILAEAFKGSGSLWLQSVSEFWISHFNSGNPTFEYLALYFALIVLFSYFYISITFKPDQVAENIQKSGGFIPGIRPGKETAEYIEKVSNRLNLWGSTSLGLIALVPLLFTMFTQLSSSDLIISGAGLIIVVGVVLEIIRQIKAQMVSHDYDKLS